MSLAETEITVYTVVAMVLFGWTKRTQTSMVIDVARIENLTVFVWFTTRDGLSRLLPKLGSIDLLKIGIFLWMLWHNRVQTGDQWKVQVLWQIRNKKSPFLQL